MILCDREIQALLDDGQLVIEPRPSADSRQWSSTSVDLTLHGVVLGSGRPTAADRGADPFDPPALG